MPRSGRSRRTNSPVRSRQAVGRNALVSSGEAEASERIEVLPLGLMGSSPAQGQGGGWMQLVPLIFFFVVIYFLLIRPARRRQKQVSEMIEALKPGDRVVTSGGIIGTILAVDRTMIQLRIADKVKVDITRSSVVSLHEPEDPSASDS